ncbi:MAG TPA: PilT/PilU family type 4a pilus ATPase [Dissulfurispiraceae bacterium]|nr:PilT/PilU family type 4a pilus ATPase [Dissulfurispiraceae bacterium]
MADLIELLKYMIDKGGSDLHITTGTYPRFRVGGRLQLIEDYRILTPEDTMELCCSFMNESQMKKFDATNEVDVSFGVKGLSRFRANIFRQRGAVAGTFREIPFHIKGFHELGIPEVVEEMLRKTQGLILVTGPTGSGKSTTLASMIETINLEREAHIITIEDPIEFLHSHNKCLINQRELDSDTPSFSSALKYVLRQDPDVVMVSSLKDSQTVEAVLTIAETGHLTLASMHTNTVIQTILRLIEMFPHANHEYARNILAECIEGIISQRLIKKKGGNGRVLAAEILIPTPAIRTLIKEGRINQIYPIMQTLRSGLKTLNQALVELVSAGSISYKDAVNNSPVPEEIIAKLNKGKGLPNE